MSSLPRGASPGYWRCGFHGEGYRALAVAQYGGVVNMRTHTVSPDPPTTKPSGPTPEPPPTDRSKMVREIPADAWPDHLTVGQLRAQLAELPDDAPVYFERITDYYFDGKRMTPWPVLRLWGDHVGGVDEFIRASQAWPRDGRAIIFGHY